MILTYHLSQGHMIKQFFPVLLFYQIFSEITVYGSAKFDKHFLKQTSNLGTSQIYD